MLCPEAPVPKHRPGCSHINASLPLCIFAFFMSSMHLLIHKSAQAPIFRCDQTSPRPCSHTSFCPNISVYYYVLFCSNAIYLNQPLPQCGSTPMPFCLNTFSKFCPNAPLLQRSMQQSASAPMPLCSNTLFPNVFLA